MTTKTFFNKSWYYALFLITGFPLFGIKLTSFSIILLGVLSIITIVAEGKKSFNKENLKWLLLFSSIYLIYLFSSFFYPFDRASGFVLERKLSLIVFPVILFISPINITKKHLNQLLLAFALITLGVTVFTNMIILIKGIPEKYTAVADFSFSYRTFFEDIAKLHPTYISIYLAFSSLIFLKMSSINNKILYRILSITCFIAMVPIAAKLPMIAFIVALGIYFFIQPAIWKKVRYWFFISIIGISIAAFTLPSLKIRVNEIINHSFTPPQGFSYNSMDIRVGVWQCSLDLIKEHWTTGVGPGRVQTYLNKCYFRFNTNAYTSLDYNTHNEYFSVLLSVGILGLLIFLLMLGLTFVKAYKTKDPLFISFMVLILLCFTTENVLSRQGGIVFFAFFITLFTRVYLLQNNNKLENS